MTPMTVVLPSPVRDDTTEHRVGGLPNFAQEATASARLEQAHMWLSQFGRAALSAGAGEAQAGAEVQTGKTLQVRFSVH